MFIISYFLSINTLLYKYFCIDMMYMHMMNKLNRLVTNFVIGLTLKLYVEFKLYLKFINNNKLINIVVLFYVEVLICTLAMI